MIQDHIFTQIDRQTVNRPLQRFCFEFPGCQSIQLGVNPSLDRRVAIGDRILKVLEEKSRTIAHQILNRKQNTPFFDTGLGFRGDRQSSRFLKKVQIQGVQLPANCLKRRDPPKRADRQDTCRIVGFFFQPQVIDNHMNSERFLQKRGELGNGLRFVRQVDLLQQDVSERVPSQQIFRDRRDSGEQAIQIDGQRITRL